MLTSFSGLTQQLFERPFRSMLYSVYNIADEDRYIVRYRSYGYDTDIDSLECMIFDVNDIENNEMKLFKRYIETEIQNDKTVIGIMLSKTSKGKYNLIAIKPKSIEVSDIIKND